MSFSYKTVIGGVLIALGTIGLSSLLFFYGVVLFSEEWTFLSKMNESLRLVFSIRSGLLVMYAAFAALAIPCFLLVLYGAQLFSGKRYISKLQSFFLVSIWFIAVILGFFITLIQVQALVDRIMPFSSDPAEFDITSQISPSTQMVFKTTLKNEVSRTQGMPIEGFVPSMFLKSFSGLTITDFEGVEASIGSYTIESGKLVHKLASDKLIHSAATAVTDKGLETLLANVSIRLGVDLTKDGTLTQIMDALIAPGVEDVFEDTENDGSNFEGGTGNRGDEAPINDMTVCTMDAKICPDGSAVGRQGPWCEFAACLSEPKQEYVCTEAQRTRACTKEYAPVCGLVSVQCVTTPCNPVPETFSNGCSACSQTNVLSYTEGMCSQ